MDHIDRAEQANRVARRSLVEKAAERLYAPPKKDQPERSEPAQSDLSGETAAEYFTRPRPVAPRVGRLAEVDFTRLMRQGILTPDSKRTQITEQIRLIKQKVLPNRWDGSGKNANLVMVTSAGPGEGKTFTAINLAMSIASERDLTVLLVDADLTKRCILPRLGLTADKGLVDVLRDHSVDLADVVIRTNVERLSILPAGRSHAMSTELLGSDRMRQIVEELAQRYASRVVIFDAPPVLATSEPAVLAQHMHQVVFVVEAEATRRGSVKVALDLINGCQNIGLVLNKANTEFGSTQFGYYFKEYAKSASA
jgi:receptor protein-tyrosine kinase